MRRRMLADVDDSMSGCIPDLDRVVGLRNRLAHGYDTIDDSMVWSIATTDVPALLSRLRSLLGSAL